MLLLKIEKNKINMYIYFFLINLYYCLSKTVLSNVFFDGIMILALIFWLLCFFIEKKLRLSWKYIPIILLILLNYYELKDSRMLVIVLSVICVSGTTNYTNILKFIFIERLFITISIILLAITEIIPNTTIQVERGIRYCLGFQHPNQVMVCFGTLIFLYLCINKDNMSQLKFGVLFIINIISYFITYSRTALMCISITIILSYIQYYIGIEKILLYIARYIYIVLLFLSLYIPTQLSINYIPFIGKYISEEFFYSYKLILRQLDTALASRMTLSASYLRYYGFTWLGKKIDFSVIGKVSSYYVLDSGYLNLLYGCGIIGSLIFIMANVWAIKILLQKKEHIYVVVMIGIAIWGFTEDVLYSMQFNFTLLFLGVLLGEQKRKNNYIEKERG